MRYSTLASTVLLAVATAPALAHPVTIRATEDASIVERELQDGLIERGYYDDLVSRDLEARTPVDSRERAAITLRRMREQQERQRKGDAADKERAAKALRLRKGSMSQPSKSPHYSQSSGVGPSLQHPKPQRPSEKAKFLPPREYDLDGELFIRTTADASGVMVERELQDALMERGYYDDLVSRDLEARKNFDHGDPVGERERAARALAQRRAAQMEAAAQRLRHVGMTNQGHAGPSRPPHPPQGGSGQNGSGRGSGAQPRPREYDLDGELFERSFEVDELD
ncbi:hypothetical protein EVJ58_g4998 [Rhodofomes roseus]|uniref:Uncharacterized protein n=1 Tax=Rhodofomes roseus TaxID=34475 RepID=A0A4Y9YI84_9APHY|nr:hypothetical protein EVJ58_g4998 [Rhodofomes roseus]